MAKFWVVSEAGFFFKRPDSDNNKEWKFVLAELEMLFVEDKAEKINNGYMIPQRDSKALIEALEEFIKLSIHEKAQMGLDAREKVVIDFDRHIVVANYMGEVDEV